MAGIFHVGMFEFDEGYVYTSLSTARSLFEIEQGVGSVQLMLNDPMDALAWQKPAGFIRKCDLSTDMDGGASTIFTALQVEKNDVFLLAFVALVAAFSITNTLITLTVQKTHEIGLMKALVLERWYHGDFSLDGIGTRINGYGMRYWVGIWVLHYRNEVLQFSLVNGSWIYCLQSSISLANCRLVPRWKM